MQITDLILPDNEGLALEAWALENESLVLHIYTRRREMKSPCCATLSERVHSRHVRTLRDLPCSDYRVQLALAHFW